MAIEIPLIHGCGLVALVDDEDAAVALQHIWRFREMGTHCRYALRYRRCGQRTFMISLHGFILGCPPQSSVIDHINGDGLDNRRSNLRFATRAQNSANRRQGKNSRSPYKGVVFNSNSWRAYTGDIHIGRFATAEDAACAHDAAVRERYGTFGTYNFPLPGERSALTGQIMPLVVAA